MRKTTIYRNPLLLLVLLSFSFHLTAEVVIVKPGSELIDGTRLKPFSATWTQYAISPEGKSENATYQEQLLEDKDTGNWLHIQKVTHAGGVTVTNSTEFEKATMTPLIVQQTFENAPPQAPASRQYLFNEAGYRVETQLNDGKVVSRDVVTPTTMFNVANLGLVFAAMALEQGKTYRMPSTFPQYQDGQYWMDVTAVRSLQLTDKEARVIPAWQLDVYWLNIKEGDEYPAGPKGSGGAYIISQAPELSGAPVSAYLNDTMQILQDGLSFSF